MPAATTKEKKRAEYHEASELLEVAVKLLDPAPDILALTEAGEHIRRAKGIRHNTFEGVQRDLRALAQALEQAKTSATRPTTVPSASEHTQTMDSLEKSRYTSAKTIMDNEAQIQEKEQEIKKLREQIAELERSDPLEDHDLDSVALRARIMKDMGFDTIQDATGNVDKIVIRTQSGDVRIITPDNSKPPHELAKELWDINSS